MSRSMPILAIFFNLCLFFGHQDSMTEALTVSNTCFKCICEAATGCDLNRGCNGQTCGPFRITRDYWVGAGKPQIHGRSVEGDGFEECTSDLYCASRTIQTVMERNARDCDGDGIINCDDYLRMHQLGVGGCSNSLDTEFENTYKRCMTIYNA
ncbi:lysozyme-like [Halictus rubicundus]|uniref:lysozyme-like n=1 Tax=Halictus rubicundus TaxID=77578 RepID=UPI004036899C